MLSLMLMDKMNCTFSFFLCFVVSASIDISQNAEVDLSCSGLTELDLGADEVFIVSSAPSPSRLPFSPHTVRTIVMTMLHVFSK